MVSASRKFANQKVRSTYKVDAQLTQQTAASDGSREAAASRDLVKVSNLNFAISRPIGHDRALIFAIGDPVVSAWVKRD